MNRINNGFKDETGHVYGRLTVISKAYQNKKKEWYWNCVCSCGNTTTVRGCHLRSGEIKSCMCLQHEVHQKITTTHGLTYTRDYQRIQGRKRYWKEKYLDVNWNVEKERILRSLFGACVLCGTTEREHQEKYKASLEVDHIKPLKLGNGLSETNATLLCKDCNRAKHAKDLDELSVEVRERILLAATLFEEYWNALS